MFNHHEINPRRMVAEIKFMGGTLEETSLQDFLSPSAREPNSDLDRQGVGGCREYLNRQASGTRVVVTILLA